MRSCQADKNGGRAFDPWEAMFETALIAAAHRLSSAVMRIVLRRALRCVGPVSSHGQNRQVFAKFRLQR